MLRTAANESCQPGEKMKVGLISSITMAASESVFTGEGVFLKRNDVDIKMHIKAALRVGALGGTARINKIVNNMQMRALWGFRRPKVLQTNQTSEMIIPKCKPERLIKCRRPVFSKAL